MFDIFFFAAFAKRSHENCVSASGGAGGERNFRQRSNSPVEPASPSSSSVSVKKKMVCTIFLLFIFCLLLLLLFLQSV